MDPMRSVLRLIEADDEAAGAYRRLLEAEGLEVERVAVGQAAEDYADLAADWETGAVLIAQRLGGPLEIGYTGLDLADFLRTLQAELPIYLLVADHGEVPDDQGESVDGVIVTAALQKAPGVYAKRILRAMQRYTVALTERQRRHQQLIDRKLAGELSAEEEAELEQLRGTIARPFGPAVSAQERKWEDELRQQRELLDRLETITRGLGSDTPDAEA
jgi:FixJ family two-component response regulator